MLAPDLEALVGAARGRWHEQRESKSCCVRCLVELAQHIERRWDDERARLALLGLFREALLELRGSRHEELRWMGALGEKMKSLAFPLDHFLNIALPLEREHTRGLQEYEFLSARIDFADRAAAPAPARLGELHVVADNLRSAFNVGAIFRTAECLGVCRLHLCGYTATPADAHVEKTTMGAHALVSWAWTRSALATIAALRAEGVACVALETVRGAPMCWDYAFPPRVALVLGNERHGLGPDVLAACDGTVQLPCVGVKNSMNVGVAFGMCAYEVARQWTVARGVAPAADGDESPAAAAAATPCAAGPEVRGS